MDVSPRILRWRRTRLMHAHRNPTISSKHVHEQAEQRNVDGGAYFRHREQLRVAQTGDGAETGECKHERGYATDPAGAEPGRGCGSLELRQQRFAELA